MDCVIIYADGTICASGDCQTTVNIGVHGSIMSHKK
jgi:hypothetical protein